MMHKVGIFRTGEELSEAVAEIGQLLVDCDKAVLRCKDPGVNPELAFALRLKGMLRLAMTVAKGAQARTESRGAPVAKGAQARTESRGAHFRTAVRIFQFATTATG
jgi:succinate dehydrogenase/fumarate reductase flavoprotein subunit